MGTSSNARAALRRNRQQQRLAQLDSVLKTKLGPINLHSFMAYGRFPEEKLVKKKAANPLFSVVTGKVKKHLKRRAANKKARLARKI